MTRLLIAVLSLSAMGYLAYRSMYAGSMNPDGASAPKQRLENVQKAADRIEVEQEKRLEDVEAKMKQE